MGILTEIFGYTPRVKILEVFVENHKEVLAATEIARMTNLEKIVVLGELDKLRFYDVVEFADIKNRLTYKLKMDSPTGKILVLLEQSIYLDRLGQIIDEVREEKYI
jgi:hypothetical protein